jgi:hypothetical protein
MRRIADYKPTPPVQRDGDFGTSIGLSMVEGIENSRATALPHDAVVRAAIATDVLSIKRDRPD